jgi:hypothetical protein
MMMLSNLTIYQILNHGAKTWWAHQALRSRGRLTEARQAERRDILNDVDTLRKARFMLIAEGRWMIFPGHCSMVSGYGGLSHPMVLACLLLGIPSVDYSALDRDTCIILPVPETDCLCGAQEVGMLDSVPFGIYAAIARYEGAILYNLTQADLEEYIVSRAGSKWRVTQKESIMDRPLRTASMKN